MPASQQPLQQQQQLDETILENIIEVLAKQLDQCKIALFFKLDYYMTLEEQDAYQRLVQNEKQQLVQKNSTSAMQLLNTAQQQQATDAHKSPSEILDEEIKCLLKYWSEEVILRAKSAGIKKASTMLQEHKKEFFKSVEQEQLERAIVADTLEMKEKAQLKQNLSQKEQQVQELQKELAMLHGVLARREKMMDDLRKGFFHELAMLRQHLVTHGLPKEKLNATFFDFSDMNNQYDKVFVLIWFDKLPSWMVNGILYKTRNGRHHQLTTQILLGTPCHNSNLSSLCCKKLIPCKL